MAAIGNSLELLGLGTSLREDGLVGNGLVKRAKVYKETIYHMAQQLTIQTPSPHLYMHPCSIAVGNITGLSASYTHLSSDCMNVLQ